jgi:hypothetical protein
MPMKIVSDSNRLSISIRIAATILPLLMCRETSIQVYQTRVALPLAVVISHGLTMRTYIPEVVAIMAGALTCESARIPKAFVPANR